MAERKVTIPSARVKLVNENGFIDPTWLRFFTDLHERTGGGGEDKVEVSAGAAGDAQASADAAAASAQIAQDLADELEDRIGFDFEFDIR